MAININQPSKQFWWTPGGGPPIPSPMIVTDPVLAVAVKEMIRAEIFSLIDDGDDWGEIARDLWDSQTSANWAARGRAAGGWWATPDEWVTTAEWERRVVAEVPNVDDDALERHASIIEHHGELLDRIGDLETELAQARAERDKAYAASLVAADELGRLAGRNHAAETVCRAVLGYLDGSAGTRLPAVAEALDYWIASGGDPKGSREPVSPAPDPQTPENTASAREPENVEPSLIDLVQELRETVGLFSGAMPITPKSAWEEALAAVRQMRERTASAEAVGRAAERFVASDGEELKRLEKALNAWRNGFDVSGSTK